MTKIDFTRTDQSYDIANGINTMLWAKMTLLAEKKPTACRFCVFPAASVSAFVIVGGRTAAIAEPIFKALGNFLLFPFKKDCHFTKGFFQLGVAITRVMKLALIPFDILREIVEGVPVTIIPALSWKKATRYRDNISLSRRAEINNRMIKNLTAAPRQKSQGSTAPRTPSKLPKTKQPWQKSQGSTAPRPPQNETAAAAAA